MTEILSDTPLQWHVASFTYWQAEVMPTISSLPIRNCSASSLHLVSNSLSSILQRILYNSAKDYTIMSIKGVHKTLKVLGRHMSAVGLKPGIA